MRGFVFALKPGHRRVKHGVFAGLFRFSDTFKKYGILIFYISVFAIGTLGGSLCAAKADSSFLEKMDFLFTTNIDVRLNQPVLSTFAASFASNFIFILFVFLCSFAPWGCLVIFAAPAFKGFGTGLSAGYLFVSYGLKGIGFYLLVILGGTFLFCFALIICCLQSHTMSLRISKLIFRSQDSDTALTDYVGRFLMRSLYILVLSAVASVADMLLWTAFSDLFF